MTLNELLPLLACPCDEHGALALVDSEAADEALVAQCCGRVYPVVDGIPVLLMDQAQGSEE